jgi:hypothetical protein
LEW